MTPHQPDNRIRQALFVALVCLIALALSESTSAQKPSEAANVTVGKVSQFSLADSQSFVGTLQPILRSTIGSAVEGRVTSVDLMPGDSVTKNQPVAELRTGTLEIELETANIALQLSEQSLLEMEKSLPKDIELAEARVNETTALLQFSKTDYDRSRRLRGNTGAISQGELELARSRYLADQQAAKAAQIEFDKLKSTKQIRLTQSKLNVEAAQQEVNRLLDLKEKYTVRAPFKGVVTQKLTDVGEWITQGQPIAEIVQLDPIELVVNAPQEQLQQIQESMVAASEGSPLTATIEFEGLDGPISGVVKSIVSQADLRSRTFPVRIEIDNQKIGNGYLLQPGMLGRATLTIGPKTEMLMIKKDALVLSSGRTKVFKVSSRGSTDIVVEVPVKTGSTSGDWIQVIGKLTTNDQVVLMGNERLRSGQEISISSSTEDTP